MYAQRSASVATADTVAVASAATVVAAAVGLLHLMLLLW
jgi:hypothetical protein